MRRIALLGASGYVGSEILLAMKKRPDVEVLAVGRGDDWAAAIEGADGVIHCANPAGRFAAERDPLRDFDETVQKTVNFLRLSMGKSFLLISTLSCRTAPETTYGRNRLACEGISLALGASVVRLGPMFGGSRKRDTLHDIIRGAQVFVSSSTRYAYVDVAWVGRYIAANFSHFPNTVVEIGARDTIELSEVARALNSSSSFGDRDDSQFPLNFSEGPDAAEVLEFARSEASRISDWR